MLKFPQRTVFDRLIAPWVLFLGIAVGFGICCLAGYVVSRQNHFQHFERFHIYLTPQSQFYPTACQVRELARSQLDPDKIVVIVGGDSVLQGYAQSPAQVWTKKLQTLLGNRYQVINFGWLCGRTGEFGATAAEFLARSFPKLILLTNQPVGEVQTDPDGNLFKYFFWDAYGKGLLLPHPERDARFCEMEHEVEPESLAPGRVLTAEPRMRPKADRMGELQGEMFLDSTLHFTDLWNTLGYTHFFTVWTHVTRASFTRARQDYTDDDWGQQPNCAMHLAIRRQHIRHILTQMYGTQGKWWVFWERCTLCLFPQPTRKRTLILVTWWNPLCFDELSSRDMARQVQASRRIRQRLTQLGFSAVEIGKHFPATDYADDCHLVESGGAKMAAEVAPKVRELAKRLGYLK